MTRVRSCIAHPSGHIALLEETALHCGRWTATAFRRDNRHNGITGCVIVSRRHRRLSTTARVREPLGEETRRRNESEGTVAVLR